ncbi:hypothetical protein F5I97DRAFT_60151 [Phlebopus sp. FC_14]|nr:hypothetical protein F5I97DRAFT_60151 [Phlebopus sp. FC_14]
MIEAAKESQKVVDGAMNLARTKLIYDNKLDKCHYSTIAMLAVLITIDYEPKRVRKGDESHVYPSEPFIAEAASRQMHHYLQSDNSSMIELLAQELTNGLVDCGQKGEVVTHLPSQEGRSWSGRCSSQVQLIYMWASSHASRIARSFRMVLRSPLVKASQGVEPPLVHLQRYWVVAGRGGGALATCTFWEYSLTLYELLGMEAKRT